MPSAHEVPPTVLTGTHQITGCFLLSTGNTDLHDLTQMHQTGQMGGVALIFSELN